MRENASAIPYNGGNYSYLLNFTTKAIAIVAATITSLDAITTVAAPSKTPLIVGDRIRWERRRISCGRSRLTLPSLLTNSLHPRPVLRNLSPWNPRLKSSLPHDPRLPHPDDDRHRNHGGYPLGKNGQ